MPLRLRAQIHVYLCNIHVLSVATSRNEMKKKLTITIDSELIPVAKRYARTRSMSLSALIEHYLVEATHRDQESFASRWRGKFRPAEQHGDPRYEFLKKKYFDDSH